MVFIGLLLVAQLVSSLQFHNRYCVKRVAPPLSVLMSKDNNELFRIDTNLEKLTDEIKQLRKQKLDILSNKKGLKMVNETEIEKLKVKKVKREREDIDDEFDEDFDLEDEDEDLDEEEESFFQNLSGSGIRLIFKQPQQQKPTETDNKKTENFEVIRGSKYNFTDIGGYDVIKSELMQCADMLTHHKKYAKFNVRTPKGLILEGPPGNGKTLIAKCFAGQINVSFIATSGSQFQEKYVGVGPSRVRELFALASENKPCIVFIDEMDAIGRKRSADEGGHNSERDSTLNELLVALDGFKSTYGVFLIGATNRVDLLDKALTRPGRIDKSIFIGLPDAATRKSILQIHIQGKPHGKSVNLDVLTEMTQGLSGAQIENLLNEAMLHSIRNSETKEAKIEKTGLDFIFNRILVGTQSTENLFTEKMLYQIAIHEMGHAIVGVLSPDYSSLVKVSLNTWSPKTPGYTLFETKDNEVVQSKKKLFNHLSVLLAGRIAEEEFFGESISTGASQDLEEVKKLAYSMIVHYGMGSKLFYPNESDNAKETIDREAADLVERAYMKAKLIIIHSKKLIDECAKVLVVDKILTAEFIHNKIRARHMYLTGGK